MSDLLHKCQSPRWAAACIEGLEGEVAALKSDVESYMAIAKGEMAGRIELQARIERVDGELKEANATIERVDEIVSRMECLPQDTVYTKGTAYEFRTALEEQQ